MAETFKFELVSPERLLISKDVRSVLVPGDEGDFMIMPNHSPVMSTLRPGIVEIDDGESKTSYFVKGGFAEAGPTSLTLLAEFAIELETLTGDRLAEEIKTADELKEKATGDLALKHANDMANCLAGLS